MDMACSKRRAGAAYRKAMLESQSSAWLSPGESDSLANRPGEQLRMENVPSKEQFIMIAIIGPNIRNIRSKNV
jgi:hypothetical protein